MKGLRSLTKQGVTQSWLLGFAGKNKVKLRVSFPSEAPGKDFRRKAILSKPKRKYSSSWMGRWKEYRWRVVHWINSLIRGKAFNWVVAVKTEKFLEFLPPPSKCQLHLNPLSIKVLTVGLVCIIQDGLQLYFMHFTVGSSEILDIS